MSIMIGPGPWTHRVGVRGQGASAMERSIREEARKLRQGEVCGWVLGGSRRRTSKCWRPKVADYASARLLPPSLLNPYPAWCAPVSQHFNR